MMTRSSRLKAHSKAIVHGDWSPAQGVCGDARLLAARGIRAPGAGAGQFRPSRRRLSECAGDLGRSGRLRAGVRARPPLPGLDLQLSDRRCRPARCAGSRATCRRACRTIAASPACAAPAWSSRATTTIETSIDRFGGDYRVLISRAARRRRRLQGRLRRRQQMPRLDLCAAGLCRQGRALLPEERHQAAAAQGGVYLGRGAVTATAPPSSQRTRALVGWAKAPLRRAPQTSNSCMSC